MVLVVCVGRAELLGVVRVSGLCLKEGKFPVIPSYSQWLPSETRDLLGGLCSEHWLLYILFCAVRVRGVAVWEKKERFKNNPKQNHL